MATISELVDRFALQERSAGNILDIPDMVALAIAAAEYYSGYAVLAEHLAIPILDPVPVPPTPYPAITGATTIDFSEWALIKPLFLLFVERETALQLEASRGMGVDPYGRASSEIIADITKMQLEFPTMAFYSEIISI